MNSSENSTPTDTEIGENVINAVRVLLKTYENIKKLADSLNEIALKETVFRPCPQNAYLTWTSSQIEYGWLYRFILKCYTKEVEPDFLYTVEISLDEFNGGIPAIILGIHSYIPGCRPKDFYSTSNASYLSHRHHRHDWYTISVDDLDKFDTIFVSQPKKDINYEGSKGVNSAIFKKIPLIGLKREEIKFKVFEGLDSLTIHIQKA